jgi:hypothetical protein
METVAKVTASELVEFAREAVRAEAAQSLVQHETSVGYEVKRARQLVEEKLGVSADSFVVEYREADKAVHLVLGDIELVVTGDESRYSTMRYALLRLSGGACPKCGDRLLSGQFTSRAHLGSAIASVEEARLTGERPRTGFFEHVKCRCDESKQAVVNPYEDAVDKLASALAEVLALGGHPIAGEE